MKKTGVAKAKILLLAVVFLLIGITFINSLGTEHKNIPYDSNAQKVVSDSCVTEQEFVCQSPGISYFGLMLGDLSDDAAGTLAVALYDADSQEKAGEAVFQLADLKGAQTARFPLDKVLNQTYGRRFLMTVEMHVSTGEITLPMYQFHANNVQEVSSDTFCFCIWYTHSRAVLFLVLAAIFMLLVASVVLFRRQTPLESVYLMLLCAFGLLYFVILPMFGAPDEFGHFMRSYEIAEGKLLTQNSDVGGITVMPDNSFVPVSDFLEDKATYEVLYHDQSVRLSEEPAVYSNANLALYSPLCYLPQSLGIFLARLCTDNRLVIWYSGRLCNLIFSILLLFYAIKLLDAGRRTLFLVTLNPMFLHQMVSYSSDAVINVCSIVLFALVFRLRHRGIAGLRDKIILAAVCIMIALCKVVYLPFVFLVFLVPSGTGDAARGNRIYKGVLVAVCVALNLGWLFLSSRYLVAGNPGVDAFAQARNAVMHPFSYIQVLCNSVYRYGYVWLTQLFGAQLGWLSVPVNALAVSFYMFVFAADSLIRSEDDADTVYTVKAKWVLVALVLLVAMLTLAGLYCQWNAYGSNVIDGVQGRYFIPLLLWIVPVVKKGFVRKTDGALCASYLPVVCQVNFAALAALYVFYV